VCCEATSGSSERLTVASVEGASGLSSGVNGVRVKLGVCTGVSCTQDGSKALLEMFNALEEDTPEELSVEACGCFGKCGEGPNVIDLGSRTIHKRLRTPDEALALLGGISISPDLAEAFLIKHKGNHEMSESRTQDAIQSYTEALRLLGDRRGQVFDQVRLAILSNRSAARLEQEDTDGAETDAGDAIDMFPAYAPAWKRLGDVHTKRKEVESAIRAYETASKLDPKSSKDMEKRISKARRLNKRFGLF